MRVEHRRVARSSHRRSAQEEPPSSKTSQDCRQRCAVKRADADNGCYNPGMRYLISMTPVPTSILLVFPAIVDSSGMGEAAWVAK